MSEIAREPAVVPGRGELRETLSANAEDSLKKSLPPLVLWLVAGVVMLAVVAGLVVWKHDSINWKYVIIVLIAAFVTAGGYKGFTFERARRREHADMIYERRKDMRDLRGARRRSMVVFVANQAGNGSKTITSGYLAVTYRDYFPGTPIVIVECRRDSAEGVMLHDLSSDKVMSIRKFYGKLKDGSLHDPNGRLNNELVFECLTESDQGIFYLQADTTTPKDDTFNVQAASAVIAALKTTGAIIIIDSGNNPSDPITIGMANEAHVGVFPTTTMRKSLTLRSRTIDTLRAHVRSPIVNDSISVLNAVRRPKQVDRLKELMGPIPGRSRVFVTLFDPYMHDNTEDDKVTDDGTDRRNVKIVDRSKLRGVNREAFDDMAYEILSIFVSQQDRQHGTILQET